jgi:hypothetical protein
MDIFTIMGSCLRRWYVTLPLLLLTALVSLRAYEGVPPRYTASVSFVVLPSLLVDARGDDDSAAAVNPYSNQGGTYFAAAVLTKNINGTAFRDRLGLTKDHTEVFEAWDSDDAPVVTIEATDNSQQQVYGLLDQIRTEAGEVLDEFQQAAGARRGSYYRLAPAVPVGPVQDVTPSRYRAAGAFAVIGLALTMAAAAGLDALLLRRRRRSEEAAKEARAAVPDSSTDDVARGVVAGRAEVEATAVARVEPDEAEARESAETTPAVAGAGSGTGTSQNNSADDNAQAEPQADQERPDDEQPDNERPDKTPPREGPASGGPRPKRPAKKATARGKTRNSKRVPQNGRMSA